MLGRARSLAGIALLALAACGGGEDPARADAAAQRLPPPNQPPRIDELRVEPSAPVAGQRIQVFARASDPDEQPVRIRYEWWLRGELLERGTRPWFESERLRKGDSLQLVAVADDGRLSSAAQRRFIVLANRPPELIEVELVADAPLRPRGSLVAAPVADDADGDRLRFDYEWLVNGRSQRPRERRFDTRRLRRGDRVRVRVTAHDGEASSRTLESETVEIANSPPHFAGIPAAAPRGEAWVYTLEARDPDGDRRLRYRLESGPAGMGIDSVLGQLVWRPHRGQTGMHLVKVRVEDAHGDGTTLRFRVHARAVVEHAPPAAAAP